MSEACRIDGDSFPLSQARRLDEVLHRFEDVWRAGSRPAIEDYLGDIPEPERAALVRELVAVEVYYRRLGGDDPQPADYQERFPALEPTWLAQEVAGRAASTADPSPLTAERAPSPGSGEEIEVAQGQISPLGTLRYHPLRFHAKGALGEVFVAQDEELNREVALKRMQRRSADAPELRRRFLGEAEITARLEHPGIVPVYGLGQYADGRPFYAMRFIKGDNLKAAIQHFHAADAPERDPSERRPEQHQVGSGVVLVQGLGQPGVIEGVLPELGGQAKRVGADRLILEPAGIGHESRVQGHRGSIRQVVPHGPDQPEDHLACRRRRGID